MRSMAPSARRLALLLVLGILLAACSGGEDRSGGLGGDALADGIDLSGVQMTVGSKNFTEQLILGEILKLALTAAGAEVADQTGLQGSAVVRAALLNGQIDAYWEYTGTGWITHLGKTEPKKDSQSQFDAVKKADASNDIAWFALAPVNNTYAIAMKDDGPDISKVSEVGDALKDNPGLCAETEFISRGDGLPGLEKAYGFEFEKVVEVQAGLVYSQVGTDCTFGEVFTTDGRIPAQHLKTLEDDENFFPKYNAAMTMRSEVYDEHAKQYDELFGKIAEKLTNKQMIKLNTKVDVDGKDPADVAEQFLVDNKIISG